MDLKTLSQRTGIRDHELRYAWAFCNQPAALADLPKEVPEEAAMSVAIVATLSHFGIEGQVVREILRRTRAQIEDHKTVLNVDLRGDVPVTVRIDISHLRERLKCQQH